MMRDFEPAVDSTIELMMSKLDDFVASGQSLQLARWMQFYTFDVLYVPFLCHRFFLRLTRLTEVRSCSAKDGLS